MNVAFSYVINQSIVEDDVNVMHMFDLLINKKQPKFHWLSELLGY